MICRLCGGENLRLEYKQGNKSEFLFYRCLDCRLINYDTEGGLDQQKYDNSLINTQKKEKIKIVSRQTYEFIKKHITIKGKILDIGCGNGDLLYFAKEDGWDIKGIELSPVLTEYARKRLGAEIVQANFLEYNVSKNIRYDVIVLRHVLEHLTDPISAMRKIHSLLSLEGYAVLEFPNIDAPELRIKRFINKTCLHKKKYGEKYRPGHCNEFCKDSFMYLLNITGFDLIVWQTYSSKPIADFVYNRIHIGNKARTVIRKKTE